MSKKLLAAGCSWTAGLPPHKGKPSRDKILWPEILAERMGLECVNLGLSGAGNEYIFSSVCDSLVEIEDISFIAIMWSEYFRLDLDMFLGGIHHVHHDGIKDLYPDWFNINSVKGPTRRSIRYAYTLQVLMKERKIPYVQVQGVRPVHRIPKRIPSEACPPNRYINDCANVIIDSPYIFNDRFLYWPIMSEIGGKCIEDILKPNEIYEDNNHPNELGHYRIADILDRREKW
jgi:hypothetical protein